MKPRTYRHNGKRLTLREWAAAPENVHGIKYKTLIGRVRKMGIGAALATPVTKIKTYEYKGKRLTLRQWVNSPENIHGLAFSTVQGRVLKKGMSISEALTTSTPNAQTYAHNGKSLGLRQWAAAPENIYNLSVGCLAGRIRAGQSIGVALSYPVAPRKYYCEGEWLSLAEWVESDSNIHGLEIADLYYRVACQHLPLWEALNIPKGSIRKQAPKHAYVVYKSVRPNGRRYTTYWIGGGFSIMGEPALLSKAEAKRIAKKEGAMYYKYNRKNAA